MRERIKVAPPLCGGGQRPPSRVSESETRLKYIPWGDRLVPSLLLRLSGSERGCFGACRSRRPGLPGAVVHAREVLPRLAVAR